MCFLTRGLSHTWGPTSPGSGCIWWVSQYYFISRRKILCIIKDNCSQVKARLGDDFGLLYAINYMHILWSGQPNTRKSNFPLSETRPVTYRKETHGTAPRLPLRLPSSSPSCSVACGSACRLLSLLTLLLERALQKRAVYRVVHIFVLKPGAQHSLSLFLPLDYVCSVKRVFKPHIGGCGLKWASVTLQKGMALNHDKNGQRSDLGGWE